MSAVVRTSQDNLNPWDALPEPSKAKVVRVSAAGLQAVRETFVEGGVAHVFSVAPPKFFATSAARLH